MHNQSPELSYYCLYLQRVMDDTGQSLEEDVLSHRVSSAEEKYEQCRLDGLSVDQSQERALSVLLEGIA